MAKAPSVRRMVSLLLAAGIATGLAPPAGGGLVAAERCNRDSVADVVRTFVHAYNRGSSERLDRMWADEPDFEWYSVSPNEREGAGAYERDTLSAYFQRRHRLGDRLRLKSLRVGPPNEQGDFGIAYRLRRRSDQARARGRYHGKASAREVTTGMPLGNETSRCVLFVWSMGKDER